MSATYDKVDTENGSSVGVSLTEGENKHSALVVAGNEEYTGSIDSPDKLQAASRSPSSTLAHGRKISKREPSKVARDLVWSGVSFRVGEKQILQDCWGHVPAGKVCAIIGTSGSGKTTMLNILAGRSSSNSNIEVAAKVQVGQQRINPVAFRRNIAYVMQDDALLATATPREALRFSATLRMPHSHSHSHAANNSSSQADRAQQIQQRVEQTLMELGLTDCADVLIGGALIKGISGGQRKRTSVGIEIINDPALLFLDEPTSGLDSYNAFCLVQLLKELATSNSAVLLTIHQPSSEVFFLFDSIICMHPKGRILYQGPPHGIPQYLADPSRGARVCPEYYNPADFIMNLCLELSEEDLNEVVMLEDADANGDEEAAQPQKDPSSSSVGVVEPVSVSVTVADHRVSGEELVLYAECGFFTQLFYLTHRELVGVFRDVGALIGRFGVSIFLSFLFGLIFLGVGGNSNADNENFNTHVGALSMIMISSMMLSATPTMLNFPEQRPVFLREYSTGTYGAAAYFLSKLCSEAPLTFMQVLLTLVMTYFMMDLQGSFILLVLAAYGLGMVSNSMAVMLGCSVKEAKHANELQPLVFVPQILFAGFFIRSEQIPVFLRWAQYLCGLKYAMYIALVVEFDLDLDSCSDSERARENCREIKDSNDVDPSLWYLPMVMLIAIFLVLRILAAFALARKARHFY